MDSVPVQGRLDTPPCFSEPLVGFRLGANVIVLQSHPAWLAAQRRARERSEAMRRHPSSRNRLLGPEAALDGNARERALRHPW